MTIETTLYETHVNGYENTDYSWKCDQKNCHYWFSHASINLVKSTVFGHLGGVHNAVNNNEFEFQIVRLDGKVEIVKHAPDSRKRCFSLTVVYVDATVSVEQFVTFDVMQQKMRSIAGDASKLERVVSMQVVRHDGWWDK